jgi:hypothetical protein
MSRSITNSKTTNSASQLQISESVRELVAAMPVVIFAKAIAEALKGSKGSAKRATTLQTSAR